jgi:hypothetical protein
LQRIVLARYFVIWRVRSPHSDPHYCWIGAASFGRWVQTDTLFESTMKKVTQIDFGDDAIAEDAKRALVEGEGHEQALTQYIRDLSVVLSLIAELIDLRTTPSDNSEKQHTAQPEGEDWEGTLDQLKVALGMRSTGLTKSYLTDAADVLMRLSKSVDPTNTSRGWRLKFARVGRGRRPDPNKMFRDSALAMKVRFATAEYGKQEAAIAKIREDGDSSKRQTSTKPRRAAHSRATTFRALKGNKPTRKK